MMVISYINETRERSSYNYGSTGELISHPIYNYMVTREFIDNPK